jgi:hypothetical protein
MLQGSAYQYSNNEPEQLEGSPAAYQNAFYSCGGQWDDISQQSLSTMSYSLNPVHAPGNLWSPYTSKLLCSSTPVPDCLCPQSSKKGLCDFQKLNTIYNLKKVMWFHGFNRWWFYSQIWFGSKPSYFSIKHWLHLCMLFHYCWHVISKWSFNHHAKVVKNIFCWVCKSSQRFPLC